MSETQDFGVVIAEGSLYALHACDNGSTYVLSNKEESTSARIQGDDLAAFLAEYETVKSQYPNYDTDQVLAQIWDQGGYSWMAEPDEG